MSHASAQPSPSPSKQESLSSPTHPFLHSPTLRLRLQQSILGCPRTGSSSVATSMLIGRRDHGKRHVAGAPSTTSGCRVIFVPWHQTSRTLPQLATLTSFAATATSSTHPPWPPSTSSCPATTVTRRSQRARRGTSSACLFWFVSFCAAQEALQANATQSSRGVTFRHRHLLQDLYSLM